MKVKSKQHMDIKLEEAEIIEQGINHVYKFYSKQHLKSDIAFDERLDNQKINKGELTVFCKDFDILIPPSKIIEGFRKVSTMMQPLSLEQFKLSLPFLSLEFGKAKTKEI